MMPGANYEIYGCSSARLNPGVSLYGSLTLEENIVAVITQDRMIDDNLKKQIKLNGIQVRVFFEKTSRKSLCAVMIRSIITFANQMSL